MAGVPWPLAPGLGRQAVPVTPRALPVCVLRALPLLCVSAGGTRWRCRGTSADYKLNSLASRMLGASGLGPDGKGRLGATRASKWRFIPLLGRGREPVGEFNGKVQLLLRESPFRASEPLED